MLLTPRSGLLFTGRDRAGVIPVVATVLRLPPYRALGAVLFGGALVFYLMTLPAAYTGGIVGWVALAYVTPALAAFAIVLAGLLSLVITLNVYAWEGALRRRGAGLSLGAVVASLLPSSLCCTSLVPSLLAALGASTPQIFRLAGRVQGAVARAEPLFLASSVVLLLVALQLAAQALAGSCRRPEGRENCGPSC